MIPTCSDINYLIFLISRTDCIISLKRVSIVGTENLSRWAKYSSDSGLKDFLNPIDLSRHLKRASSSLYGKRIEEGGKTVSGTPPTLDAITGQTKRAPALFQKLPLEWLYRLIIDPKRIRRQAIIPFFLFKVFTQKRGSYPLWKFFVLPFSSY